MNNNIRTNPYFGKHILGIILYVMALFILSWGDAMANEFAKAFDGPDADAIYLHLKAGEYQLVEPDQQYVHRRKGDMTVRMTGYTVDDSPGNPSLPYKIFHVALPPNADVSTLAVEVMHVVEKELPAPITIAPAPPYLLGQAVTPERMQEWEHHKWGVGKKIVDGRNILVYEKDAFFPRAHALVAPSGQLRKWKVLAIKFYPVRYNPVQKRAVLVTETAIKVQFDRFQQLPPQMEALLRDTTMDKRAKQLFLNYDRAREWYQRPLLVPKKQGLSYDAGKSGRAVIDPNFVIVTTDKTRLDSTALADFCFHKQDLGYSVMIVTENNTYTVTRALVGGYTFQEARSGFEDVSNDDPPYQRPQKIRKWLKDNYLELGIDYVLLIGDPDPDNIGEDDDHVGDIPMVQIWRDIISDYPTDNYYADLSGDWNRDGDDYTGEMYPFEGFSTLPDEVTDNGLFSVRWSGVVELNGVNNYPTGTDLARFDGYKGGQARFQIDTMDDGEFDAYDYFFLFDEADDPHPEYFQYELRATPDLVNGTYPIRIEWRNLKGDAYLNINVSSLQSNATAEFKHEDEEGNLVDGLRAEYFNSVPAYLTDDLSGEPVITQIEPNPYIEHITGGDRGEGGVNLYSEVTVGRIPLYDEDGDGAPDVSVLDGILNKIIAYENADVREEAWRRRVLCSTPYMYDSPEDYDTDYDYADYMGCETLRSDIAPPPLWEWFRIHEENYDGVDAEITDGCSKDKTIQAWNDPEDPDDGRGVVMWRTHGQQTYADGVFHEDQCVDLDDDKPSIVIHATCLNGLPEVGTHPLTDDPTYPLAYSLLKQGAIATIAATRNTYGGIFDPYRADISLKGNPYLMYFIAKGIFNNLRVGDVVAHVREFDALIDDWRSHVFSYNLYGDPTLSLFGDRPKSNNDTVLLLDGSGSMLSEGKWEAARDAAVLYRDVAAALRHPAFQDRYNTIVFRCIGGSNESTTVPSETGLKDIAYPLTIASLDVFEPEIFYETPIGGGLEMAYAQFDPEDEDGFYANRTVVLLSDGKHNCGADPTAIEVPEGVVVHTVGLGDDSIDSGTIEGIATATGGDFRISPSPREIEDFFVQILASTSWKLQNIPVNRDRVRIDQNKAVFLVVWDDPTANISFELDPPGEEAANVTPSGTPAVYVGMSCAYDESSANETHAFYSCDDIPADLMGEWGFANIKDGTLPVSLDDVLLKVIEDPRVLADYSLGKGNVFTGQPITLIARMTEDGVPLDGLTDVYAELIRSPAVAIGTLMAEHGTGKAPPNTANNVDRTPRAQYLLQSMEAAKVSTLIRAGGPRIELHDDGTGADERANDGVYTGTFQDTKYEGSYTFRFRSSGTSRNDVAFDRGETLSEFVKFNPASTTTDIAFPSKDISKEDKTFHATLRVTPKDAFGSHLGPFRGDLIQLWSSAGTVVPGYEDHYDGSYSFELVYPIDASPQISIAVGDVLVAERTPIDVDKPQYWFWLFIVSLMVLVIAAVFLIVRRFF